MKYPLLSGVVALFLITSGVACAGEPETSGVEIISVVPRSADVKPLAMSVPAEIRHETAAITRPTMGASSDPRNGKLASLDSRKAVPSANEDKQ